MGNRVCIAAASQFHRNLAIIVQMPDIHNQQQSTCRRRFSNARSKISRIYRKKKRKCVHYSASSWIISIANYTHAYANQDQTARSDDYRAHRPRAHIHSIEYSSHRFPLLLHSVFVLVPSRDFREISSTARCSSCSFFSLFHWRRKTLRDWIKIAGAISRTHDIGENATEALIMADTRRAVAATTFYPLTQDSHYTNVSPIIGPQSAALPSLVNPSRVSQSLQSESCKPTRKSNSSIPPRRYRQDFYETIVVLCIHP